MHMLYNQRDAPGEPIAFRLFNMTCNDSKKKWPEYLKMAIFFNLYKKKKQKKTRENTR